MNEYEKILARLKSEPTEENEKIAEIIRHQIIRQCELNRINGIIDKDLIEERNKIVHSSNPVISAHTSPELFTIIDCLREKISRSAFCRMAISEYCAAIQENGIIDKDPMEERNQIDYSSDPIISAYVSLELLTTIDSLREKMSRSAFFRMALSEYCAAVQEIGPNSSNSENSRNVDRITKPKETGGYHGN
jgi:hypothetical protein